MPLTRCDDDSALCTHLQVDAFSSADEQAEAEAAGCTCASIAPPP